MVASPEADSASTSPAPQSSGVLATDPPPHIANEFAELLAPAAPLSEPPKTINELDNILDETLAQVEVDATTQVAALFDQQVGQAQAGPEPQPASQSVASGDDQDVVAPTGSEALACIMSNEDVLTHIDFDLDPAITTKATELVSEARTELPELKGYQAAPAADQSVEFDFGRLPDRCPAKDIAAFIARCEVPRGGALMLGDYYDWNEALAAYIYNSAQPRAPFYLDVRGSILEAAGSGRIRPPEDGDWEKAFLKAVKHEVRVDSKRVALNSLRGYYAGVPRSLSFLASMVLSGYYMTTEESSTSHNFFRRFNSLLSLSPGAGRPIGMATNHDDAFWKSYNFWLEDIGLLPTATQGEGGYKFLHYPVSQCLLREADVLWINKRLAEQPYLLSQNGRTIYQVLRRDSQTANVHLQEVFADPGPRLKRLEERLKEIASELPLGSEKSKLKSAPTPSRIQAGVYRSFDIKKRCPRYFLHIPSKGVPDSFISLKTDRGLVRCGIDRPGWFTPLVTLDSATLDEGFEFDVDPSSGIRHVELPRRSFWLLSREPDDTSSASYASWGTPPAGTDFYILCRSSMASDLEKLRQEGFLKWVNRRSAMPESDWLEYEGCTVTGLGIGYSDVSNVDLLRALTPTSRLSLSIASGIRVRGRNQWISSYGPNLSVLGFGNDVTLVIEDVLSGACILTARIDVGSSLAFPTTVPGTYIVKVVGTDVPQRLVELLPLEEVALGLPDTSIFTEIGPHRVSGPLVLKGSND